MVMTREQKISDVLISKGAIDKDGNFISELEFKRNPELDRVWVPNVGRRGTSISADVFIAKTMEELLGSRSLYIVWVRKAVEHIVKKSKNDGSKGIAGLSRLVQREAVAYIRDYNKRVVNE